MKFTEPYDQLQEEGENKQPKQKVLESDVFVPDTTDESFLSERRLYNIKCLVRFLCILVFNLVPIYLFFLIFQVRDLIKTIKDKKLRKLIKLSKLFFFYTLDLLLCLSVIAMFIWFGYCVHIGDLEGREKVYENWAYNAIIFISLFTFFICYKQSFIMKMEEEVEAEDEEEIEEADQKKYKFNFTWYQLIRSENFLIMGLGKFTKTYLDEIRTDEKKQREEYIESFDKQVNTIIQKDNLDVTLGYFAMIKDQKIQNQQRWYKYNAHKTLRNQTGSKLQLKDVVSLKEQQSVKDPSPIEVLNSLGFQGFRKIKENFLLPQYLETRKFGLVNAKARNVVTISMVLMKMVIPTLILVTPLDHVVLLFTIIYTGFYLHFVQIIYEVVRNEDIKTRLHMIQALTKLIDIQEYMTNKEENNIVDISCAISLQSWDNMRHIALQIDQREQNKIDFTFWFIVLYGKLCFLAFLLCMFNLPFMKEVNYCNEPILLYNIHIDIILIALISIFRIYAGSKFNKSFEEIGEQIHRLTAVYEDLFTLFEFYFSQGVAERIQNTCYSQVIQLIKQYAELKTGRKIMENDNQQEEDRLMNSEFLECAMEKVEEMKDSMIKIQEQVEKDEEIYTNRFIGVYEANTDRIVKLLLIVGISFVPGVFEKYDLSFNLYCFIEWKNIQMK